MEQKKDFEYIKMDYSLETPEERVIKVKEIIANTPSERLTPYYLDKLAEYIVVPIEKKERKKNYILTNNHMVTVKKRELSFEGLIGKLENGEDGIYNMIANDKNIIFAPKNPITKEEIETIPGMLEMQENIAKIEAECAAARGQRAYLLRKQLIEMRYDQYILRTAYKQTIGSSNTIKSLSRMDLSEKITIDANGEVHSNGIINLYNPTHISLLLCNYAKIKEDNWDRFSSDIKWMMEDLDNLIEETLREAYPLYYDLLIYKIDGLSNAKIQELIEIDYGVRHSPEYLSSLWRNKIPKLLAERAANNWLDWHFLQEEKGKYKKCSRCGQIKLAHNHFFSKNSTSKDGWYSICKECRNKKKAVND